MNGSITVFLSLILTCICALMGGLFESARLAGCGWYVQMALNSSVDSLMSCYHREVWEKYRIFLLECENREILEREMEPYFSLYLEEAPIYPLKEAAIQVAETAAITDENGAYFEQEILDYMRVGVWTIEKNPEILEAMADGCREAICFQEVAEQYQENGRKVLRLEETIQDIGNCLNRQKEYLQAGNEELKDCDGAGFLKEAERLCRELDRIPRLVETYKRQAACLDRELEISEGDVQRNRPEMKAGTWGILREEAEGYRSYIDAQGQRYQEITLVQETAATNRRTMEEAIQEAKTVQEYLDEWEGDEEEEPDEEALWGQVLRITARFQEDERFQTPGIRDKQKMNVLEALSRLMGTDLLSFCVPDGMAVSGEVLVMDDFPSVVCGVHSDINGEKRENLLKKGVDRALLNEYAAQYFPNFRTEGTLEFSYEQEYLLQGKASDRENLKHTVNQLVAVREGLNLIALFGDAEKRSQAEGLALAVTGAGGVSVLSRVVAFFIMTVWAFAEAVEDVRTLLAGGMVSWVKEGDDWKVSLMGLAEAGASIWTGRAAEEQPGKEEEGLDYQAWLKLLFLIRGKQLLCYRMMDMIQHNISQEQPGFRMQKGLFMVSAQGTARGSLLPVKRERRKEY